MRNISHVVNNNYSDFTSSASAIMFIGCTGEIFKNNTLCNYASYGGLVLSFTTNFTSMLLIAITAWSVIQQAFERVFNAQRCF